MKTDRRHAVLFVDSRVEDADILADDLPAAVGMFMPHAGEDGLMRPQAQAGRK